MTETTKKGILYAGHTTLPAELLTKPLRITPNNNHDTWDYLPDLWLPITLVAQEKIPDTQQFTFAYTTQHTESRTTSGPKSNKTTALTTYTHTETTTIVGKIIHQEILPDHVVIIILPKTIEIKNSD